MAFLKNMNFKRSAQIWTFSGCGSAAQPHSPMFNQINIISRKEKTNTPDFYSFLLQKVLNWRSLLLWSAGKTMQSPQKAPTPWILTTFFIGFHSLHKCQMPFGTHFEIVEHNIQFFVLNKIETLINIIVFLRSLLTKTFMIYNTYINYEY